MDKILIIKLGALGDVVRTTPLLRVLKGEITWVTQTNAIPLFKNNHFVHKVLDINHCGTSLYKNCYQLVLNLDEDVLACELSSRVKTKEFIGVYRNTKGITYTDSSAKWFDMSLISKFGRKEADKRKLLNRKSYQEIIFEMLGKKFKGEEYILHSDGSKEEKSSSGAGGEALSSFRAEKELIGIETRSGDRWVGKRWPRFDEFCKILKDHQMPYLKFHQLPTLGQFINMINQTDLVVTTDSLALHLALGLQKKVVAIFTITPPDEIYDYGRTIKIVNPLLKKYFFSTKPSTKPGDKIKTGTVFNALLKLKNLG